MSTKRKLITSLFVFSYFACFVSIAHSYDNQLTHPELTKAAVQIYNNRAGNKISQEQTDWIIYGSNAEDADPRYLNHYYDPSTGKGLDDGWPSIGLSAKYWAQNQTNITSAGADYSESAILLNYRLGNYQRAYEGIGHVTHLIQDMTSPAHVLNDSHAWGDIYEKWSKRNGLINFNRLFYTSITDINNTFDEIASYTHNDFFSEERVNLSKINFSQIVEINQGEKKIKYAYNFLDGIKHKLCIIDDTSIINNCFISDDLYLNLDYWNLLNPKAIGYSAGVVDYFMSKFAEIDKEKELEKISWWQSIQNKVDLIGKQIDYKIGDALVKETNARDNGLDSGGSALQTALAWLDFTKEAGVETLDQTADYAGQVSRDTAGRVLSAVDQAESKANSLKNTAGELADSLAAKLNENGKVDNKKSSEDAGTNLTEENSKPSSVSDVGNQTKVEIAKITPGPEKKPVNLDLNIPVKPLSGGQEAISLPPAVKPVAKSTLIFVFSDNPPANNSPIDNPPTNSPPADDHPATSSEPEADNLLPDTFILAAPPAISSSSIGHFIFGANENDCRAECNLNNSGWSSCFSEMNFLVGDGTNTLAARAIDAAGNVDPTSAGYNWLVDTIAPAMAIIGAPPVVSSSSVAAFSFSSSETVVYSCGLDSNNWQSCTSTPDFFGLADGWHELSAAPTDTASNTGSTTVFQWLVDTAAPTSSIINLLPEYISSNFAVSWQGGDWPAAASTSGLADYDVEYQIEADGWRTLVCATSSTNTQFSAAVNPGNNLAFRVRARDAAGNIGVWSDAALTRIRAVNHLVISEIKIAGQTAMDEFVEFYNPTQSDISLAGYSLKRKTSSGQEYPLVSSFSSGSVKAHSYYLITHPSGYVGSTTADAVYSSASYSLAGDNTVILYSNSSTTADKVGFGAAADFETAPYPANPSSSESLERKTNGLSTAESMSVGAADENLGNGYDTDDNSHNFVVKTGFTPQASQNASEPRGQSSDGLVHLWHFDECRGATSTDSIGTASLMQRSWWTVGRWECGFQQPWQDQYRIQASFSGNDIVNSANELTFSYYWRNSSYPNEGRGYFYLKNANGNVIAGITPSKERIVVFFRNGGTSIDPRMPADSNWHLITMTYSPNSLSYYLDGQLKKKMLGNYSPQSAVAQIDLKGENYPIEIDEIAIWSRALGSEEIKEINDNGRPFSPFVQRPAQLPAQLAHSYSFDENSSTTAHDSISGDDLTVKQNVWIANGHNNSALWHSWPGQYNITKNFAVPMDNLDLSLSFWWRNRSYPNEGRGRIVLRNASGAGMFGLNPTIYHQHYYFNGGGDSTPQGFPTDANWHFLTLVYDSYQYKLKFYVDNVKKMENNATWLASPITSMEIIGENWEYEIDELNIWNGALSDSEISGLWGQ